MNNDIVPTSYTQQKQPMFSFASDENTTAGTTQLLPHAPTAPYDSYNISSPLSSLNMIYNSSQSHSEVFRFEIPGFKIIIIPNSSPHSSLYANLDNLDIQNQSQQAFTSPNVVIDNSQIQFQQDSNESFTNSNNFHC
ncbi:unnamed protein product [Rhizophagus irregularis]|uniref:Uncharacterized protein n=1 Tax=Rhizophagus irregularis TaxID=588596 RepID=A0A2N1NVI7_9GLOM|nr:hypothetical protein RhiirC2_770798 [Rhizophagus irregularis]CAB4397540.1 unnamed protein product [Rhizophagus irregularis]CAB5324286.1 unnamed protein product [Rhizophagus irregularis]